MSDLKKTYSVNELSHGTSRMQTFEEMPDAEKLANLHGDIVYLKNRLEYVDNLLRRLQQHEHGENGKLLAPFNDC